jgi:menaquinone-dependent protoporphyrinogen oxidase
MHRNETAIFSDFRRVGKGSKGDCMNRVLVAYTTKTGTTRNYAEVLSSTLKDQGLEVDVKSLTEASNLDGYDAVLIGSPINGMQLVPDATSFLAANQARLAGKKTAVFSVSYMHGKARLLWNKAIEKSTAKAAATAGASDWKVFPGRIDKPMPGFARFLFGFPADLPVDRQDPGMARVWATGLAGSLKG